MATMRSIPRVDWLSWTLAGTAWVDFEWLAQLIWYGIFRAAGMWGLVGLKAALFCAAGVCLWKTLELYRVGLASRAAAVLAWAVALSPANDIRADNFSLLFISLEWLMLESNQWDLKRQAGLVAIFIFWANLHPGFLIGLISLFAYAFESWRRKGSSELAKLAGACFFGTFLNPFGINLYLIIWRHMRDLGRLREYILEWQAPNFHSPWFIVFWILLGVSGLSLCVSLLRGRIDAWEHVLVFCLCSFLALRHVRGVLYFVATGMPLCALYLPRVWPKSLARIKTPILLLSVAALTAFFVRGMGPSLIAGQPFIPRSVPERMASFLETERAELGSRRLLNPWEWGGYLGFRFSPEYKTFVDGRYIFHPLLKPIREAEQSPEAYKKFLDQYGIDLVLHPRIRQFQPMEVELSRGRKTTLLRPLYLSFLPRTDWALIYWDDQGIVFARRKSFRSSWLDQREFKLFRPDDLVAATLMAGEGMVRQEDLKKEVDRYLKLNPKQPA